MEDYSMRRSANRTVKMSITVPLNIFNELERTLSYTQSRSKFISSAIDQKLNGSEGFSVEESTTKQLMAALLNINDVDPTLKALLLHILSK
jgi:metal-responsive CopG/Arc/MetJ family transcriptional regulator